MNKSNYNALNELHNTLRCGVPADEYSQGIKAEREARGVYGTEEK